MQVTERERYFFDLNGYLLLKGALSQDEVADINAGIDALLPIQPGEWKGYVHGHNYGDDDGINLQQIYEGGAAFEKLIDHPSWIEKVKYFVGGADTFDYNHGPLFIDECFASLRGPGEAIGLHSGGHTGRQAQPVSLFQRALPLRADQYLDGADRYWSRRWLDDGSACQPQIALPPPRRGQTFHAQRRSVGRPGRRRD